MSLFGRGKSDPELERLREELEQMRAENERLRAEIAALREERRQERRLARKALSKDAIEAERHMALGELAKMVVPEMK